MRPQDQPRIVDVATLSTMLAVRVGMRQEPTRCIEDCKTTVGGGGPAPRGSTGARASPRRRGRAPPGSGCRGRIASQALRPSVVSPPRRLRRVSRFCRNFEVTELTHAGAPIHAAAGRRQDCRWSASLAEPEFRQLDGIRLQVHGPPSHAVRRPRQNNLAALRRDAQMRAAPRLAGDHRV